MNDLDILIHKVAELERKAAFMVRVATVTDVKKDMVRVTLGQSNQGSDVAGPWMHTANHRGGATERRFYKQGQTVMILMPSADPMQAIVLPYAPSNQFKAPDFAVDSGQDEETYQLGDLRVRKKKDGYEIWLGDASDPTVKFYLQSDHGFVARYKDGGIVQASKEGAKIKMKSDFLAVIDGSLQVSQPPQVVPKDPIPDFTD